MATQIRIWDYATLQSCPWFIECPLTFCSSEEEELRKQSCPIDLPPDDIDMINNEDVCVVKVVKPEGKTKRKRGSKVDEANPTPSSQTGVMAYNPSPSTPTPSTQGNDGPKVSPILRSLRSQHVSKTIVSGASPSTPVCSVMLEKISIQTLMENGAHENPLMLKTFEFVTKVSILSIELIFIFGDMVLMLQHALDLSVILFFGFFGRWVPDARGRFLQRIVLLEVLILLLQICQKVCLYLTFHLLHM